MLSALKNFLLTHEPFRPTHMGHWIRGLYCRYYLPRFVTAKEPLMLDAACGNGRHAILLRELFPSANIEGVDIVGSTEWKTFTDPNLHFHLGDLTLMEESATRDVIVSIDTLEHIPGNERVLRSFFKALRPGGILYLAIPYEDIGLLIFPRSWYSRFYQWADAEHIGEMRRLPEILGLMKEIGYVVLLSRNSFTWWGRCAWGMETILHGKTYGKRINLLLMPLYKILGWLDVLFPIGEGDTLVIARRP